MIPHGSANATYAFVADYPTKLDVINKQVWSHRKLDWILSEASLDRSDCYFTTLLKCAVPKGSEPSIEQGQSCLYYILQELAIVRPKVIFVSGKLSFQVLSRTKLKGGLGTARTSVHKVKMPWGDVHLVATWTPSFAAFKSAIAQDIIADILMAKDLIAPSRKENYRWINKPGELIDLVSYLIDLSDTGRLPIENAIAVDTETTNLLRKGWSMSPYKKENNIATIQVAWDAGEAASIPLIFEGSEFNNPFNIKILQREIARLLRSVRVVGQNYKYDEGYFAVKLGCRTDRFVFDTMLANHFLHGGSLPNKLDFLIPRYLGWRSHKKVIDAELAAMPDDIRSYGRLSQPTIHRYGCLDTDATLQLYPILKNKLKEYDYRKLSGCEVVYPNMLEAFQERVMFPWKAILDIELRGAPIDSAEIPRVSRELKETMDAAYSIIHDSPAHSLWLLDHTVDNPKRIKYTKKTVYYVGCVKCNTKTPWDSIHFTEGKRPKTYPCPACRAVAPIRHNRVNSSTFQIIESEPEKLVTKINPASPKQMKEFFYSSRYLGFPDIPKKEGSTDKVVRAALLDIYEKKEDVGRCKILLAIGDWNKASKLYSSYATKIDDYLHLKEGQPVVSDAVTAPFELDTGVNHIHTNYFQDGTVSGRLSTRDPSLHTIPRKSTIKKLFISRFKKMGVILQADLSQAEVRGFVIETGDDTLRESFEKGIDPYASCASNVYGVTVDRVLPDQRQDFKSVVLGLLFGRGAAAIAEQTGKSVSFIKDLIENFFRSMPKLRKWRDGRIDFAHQHKCAVSRFGRVRPLVDHIDADDFGMINHAENVAVNHPIQSMVGDLCIDSVARSEYRMRREGLKSVIFNTVHDSSIVDVYLPELIQVMRILREEMFTLLPTYFPWINVPFAVDLEIGTSWGSSVSSHTNDKIITLDGDPGTMMGILPLIKNAFNVVVKEATPYVKKEANTLRMSMELENVYS